MKNYDTVSEAVNDLVKKGYTDDLQIAQDCLKCINKDVQLQPDEFSIDEFFRFEGESDPADSTIVYAISSPQKEVKGILVNAYGVYADTATSELVSKLTVN